jgi:hypothetical protein
VWQRCLIASAILLMLALPAKGAEVTFTCHVDHGPYLVVIGTNRGPPKYCKWVCWFELFNTYFGFVESRGYERLTGTRKWRKTGDYSIISTTIDWRCRSKPPEKR